MPNWCFGMLKVNSSKDKLINFLKNGVSLLRYSNESRISEEVNEPFFELHDEDDGSSYLINWIIPEECWLYVKETNRAFIEPEDYWRFPSRIIKIDDEWIMYFPLQQAWDFRDEDWCVLSNKYDVDFCFHGYESGMGFERDVEIIQGKRHRNKTIRYDNYLEYIWRCPFPELGG